MYASNNHQVLWVFFAVITIVLLYLLGPILTPFLLGALFAYLANPLVKSLEKKKLPHFLAVILIFLLFFGSVVLLVILLVPIVQEQIVTLLKTIPEIIVWMQERILPWIQKFFNMGTFNTTLSSGMSKFASALGTVLASGYSIIEWIVNLILTPVVTFYLLRDWDSVCHHLFNLVPESAKATVKHLTMECDAVLSGFFRGQLLVVLALSLIYGIGLSLIGLKTGLVIGLIGGLLSIVPFLGSIFVVVFASLASLIQFMTWESMIWVFIIYGIGQALESFLLTPYLIGDRIGLHPVVVIFAVMAGGTLFGFFGVLLALPVAAVGKVLLQFVGRQYLRVRTQNPTF